MKKFSLFVGLLSVIIISLFIVIRPVFSDQLDDINQQINALQAKLDESKNATAPLVSQLTSFQSQLTAIENQVSATEADIAQKKQDISKEFTNLQKQKKDFDVAVRSLYIKNYLYNPLVILVSSSDASDITRTLAYSQKSEDQDKAIITNLALEITDLDQKKSDLESEEIRLQSAKTKLAAQQAELQKVVDGAKAYQATLSTQIAQLSAQQQQLIAQKQASLGLPTTAYTTAGGCSSDLTNGKNPGFSPGFAFFTYGVPHRVGMSQYGAWGRAQKGQSYQQILSFYYPNTQLTTVSTSTTITVNGTNDYGETFSNQQFTIEDYLTHIYEMPSSWSSEALKAQAIAARTYATQAVMSGKTTVAPNQSFQEIKTEQNAQAWIDAVNATAGQVLESGGQPITAWFSSTGGGYTHNSGDVFGHSTSYTTTAADANGSVNSFSDLQNNAYDGPNYANSPWFYCDWGGRSQYSNTAWLKPEEVADIVNVIMLAQKDSSTQSHLSQTDKSNPDGTDTWDADRVKQELRNRGVTPYSSVSSVSVSADFGSGKTTTVQVSGDAGSQNFDGNEFKNFFDLRAPANIQIVGPLYNVEKH